VDEKREREAWIGSERFVAGMAPRGRDPRTTLLERAPAVGEGDRYGGGMLAERLEGRIAGLLGKEAAGPREAAELYSELVGLEA
jgi:hypothetical protein